MAEPHSILQRAEFRDLDELARGRFRAWAQAHENDGELPLANLEDIHRLGLLHIAASREAGGGDGSLTGRDPGAFLQAVRLVARGDSATAHCFQVHNHTLWLLDELATDQQREEILRPLTGKFSLLASVGSEPNRISMYVMQTKARREPGGWRINGIKNFATNGPRADWFVVFVAIDGVDDYLQNHMMVLIRPDMPGVTISDEWYRPHGMRAARSSVLRLDNVFVPDTQVLGEPGSYPRGRWQGRYHLGFAANYLGTSEGLNDWYLSYVTGRNRGSDPLTQLRTGEIRIALDAAAALFESAISGWQILPVVQAELRSMSAKSNAAHAAFRVIQTVVHASGATAQFDDHPLSRYIRDLETHVLHAGHDRTAQIIGQAQLGQSFDSTLQR